MQEELDTLRRALAAVKNADCLVRVQEAQIARMKMAGLDVTRAEILLHAYKEGARLAEEHVIIVRRSHW